MASGKQEGESGQEKEIVVFSIIKESTCSECGREIWKGDFLRMEADKPLCLECADMDHLLFLPSGNTALTRRSRKYSELSAVVLRFSRTRKRYERQGILVEEAAYERAEAETLSDEDKREAARERAAVARERTDKKYVDAFAAQIAALYPKCSAEEAQAIAEYTCQKHSGRVGRCAAAKEFDAEAIELAVRAHVRHVYTGYDALLGKGLARADARSAVAEKVSEVLASWRCA